MARTSSEITITVRQSDTLRTVLRACRSARKLIELVPEWQQNEARRSHRNLRKAIRAIRNSLVAE